MSIIKNKTVCSFACKAEKLVEKTVLKKLFDTKNTLKDRVFMYIFLVSSISLWMWIVGTNAHMEQQLLKSNIISIEDTIFAKIALKR